MIKALLDGILQTVTILVNVILYPINLLMQNLFPESAEFINTFTYTLNNYVSPYVGWFIYLLPPHFKSLLLLWLTFMVTFYTTWYSYKLGIKIYQIIQKIKFW